MRSTGIVQRRRAWRALPQPGQGTPVAALDTVTWPVSRWRDFETLQETVNPLEPLYGFRVQLRDQQASRSWTRALEPRALVRRAA